MKLLSLTYILLFTLSVWDREGGEGRRRKGMEGGGR